VQRLGAPSFPALSDEPVHVVAKDC
jgi:hypothetical protein